MGAPGAMACHMCTVLPTFVRHLGIAFGSTCFKPEVCVFFLPSSNVGEFVVHSVLSPQNISYVGTVTDDAGIREGGAAHGVACIWWECGTQGVVGPIII